MPASLSAFDCRDAPMLLRMKSCRHAARRLIAAEAVDVVAAHFCPYALPVLDLVGPRRFVFHFHGPWAMESKAEGAHALNVGLKRTMEAIVYRRADRFVVLSSAFANVLTNEFRVPRERISIVPGGVDVDRFDIGASRAAARALLQLPSDRPLVVTVRRLIHRVGLEGLIDAMVAVRRRVPEILLLIAGKGSRHDELQSRIAERGLAEHVRLLGFVADDDLPVLYRACDLSVVPSVALEGFGLPTIESLASGTPVLVTPVGGLPETVSGLDPALILADATAAALADGISSAVLAPGRLPSARSCAAYARESFHWPVIARKVLEVYER